MQDSYLCAAVCAAKPAPVRFRLFSLALPVCIWGMWAVLSGCALDPRAAAVWSGDLSLPEFTGSSMPAADTVVLGFSEPVTVASASMITADRNLALDIPASVPAAEARLLLPEVPPPGDPFVLSVTVENAGGNTLSLSESFSGYNPRVPALRICEVRTVYSKPRAEFIELEALEAGNLSGVRIETYGVSRSKPKNTVYEFPPAEVQKGDLVVLHYRCLPDPSVPEFADETGSDLALPGGKDASDTARDFWFPHDKAPLSVPGVFLVRERKSGALLDALLYVDSGGDKKEVPYDWMLAAAREAVSSGVWAASGEGNGGTGGFPAFDACGTTATRTLCRDSAVPGSSPAGWYVCASGKASPGKPNSGERYQP